MSASKNVTATFTPIFRFKDNGDQTLTDTFTGLVWAKDASTPTVGSCTGGTKSLLAGLDYARCLNTAKYLGYTDWWVPTIEEMYTLCRTDGSTAGLEDINPTGEFYCNGTAVDVASLLNGRGFVNVQSSHYWSSSTAYGVGRLGAWDVYMGNGRVGTGSLYSDFYVWPVRSGQSGTVCQVRKASKTVDLNKDGKGDIVLQNTNANSNDIAAWLMDGATIASGNYLAKDMSNEWQMKGIGDLDGDGKGDIVWQNVNGDVIAWLMDEFKINGNYLHKGMPSDWQIKGIGDLDGDGKGDIIWQNINSGDVIAWLMDGFAIKTGRGDYLHRGIPSDWQIIAIGDLDGDHKVDIIWQNVNSGDVIAWLMDGFAIKQGNYLHKGIPSDWQMVAIGDLDGDGKNDIVWRNTNSGDFAAWLMNGFTIKDGNYLDIARSIPCDWQVAVIGDLNGDGMSDIVLQNTATGDVGAWFISGFSIKSTTVLVKGMPSSWQIK
ncbi:FG-GAP repeat-containing protein [Candidatus Magnetobacterium bavaricum]|uniref:FG-GAP repeat-containing protein n=1 Tax=Candidatus Magnetobacterium bavaricum TaxID=29290 RepID=A0A0F3GRA4_9BACT|nr:FG-GAP repeat-containing protein [Candidatus Magnetobacterium bavaricum]